MNKLQESLLILNHFDGLINGRTEFCKRHIGFTVEQCITSKLINSIYGGGIDNPLKNSLNHDKIARECADTRIIIHTYLCLNIIDMFSFDDEYIKCFNEKLSENENLSERIRKFRADNRSLRNKIDWGELKIFRNIVLAHNLRDKKNDNRLSLVTFVHLNNLIKDFEKAIQYCETVTKIFANIKKEFKFEITDAQLSLKNEIETLKIANEQHRI